MHLRSSAMSTSTSRHRSSTSRRSSDVRQPLRRRITYVFIAYLRIGGTSLLSARSIVLRVRTIDAFGSADVPPRRCKTPPMATSGEIDVRRLDADGVRTHIDDLAAVLVDCVDGGASVSYLAPFSQEDARAAFAGWADDVDGGRRFLLAAFASDELVGTVQVVAATPPN